MATAGKGRQVKTVKESEGAENKVPETSVSLSQVSGTIHRAQVGSSALQAGDIHRLQRSIGNRATVRLIGSTLQRSIKSDVGVENSGLDSDSTTESITDSITATPITSAQRGANPGAPLPSAPSTPNAAALPPQRRAFAKAVQRQSQAGDQPGALARGAESQTANQPSTSGAKQQKSAAFKVQGGADQQIQRAIPKPSEWKSQSAKMFKFRSAELKALDNAVAAWQTAKDDPVLANRSTALNNIRMCARTWGLSKDHDAQGKVISARTAAVKALMQHVNDEIQKLKAMQRIQTQYGITLHNQAGINAAKAFYEDILPGKVAPKVKAKEWELQEILDLEKVLSFYGPLLGTQRDVASLGAQPVNTFSRVNVGLDEDGKKISKDPDTYAETFTQTVGGTTLSNISVYDKAYSPDDFVTGQQQMRGTVGHELSHALLEPLPAPAGAGPGITTMIQYFADQMAFWLDVDTRSNTAGAERPVTSYGKSNAREDLAEAMMMFFENPDKLQADCPLRFQFISTHIAPKLDKKKINEMWQSIGANAIPLAPALPPAPAPGAPAPGAPASAITGQGLTQARQKLRPPAPVPPPVPMGPAPAPATAITGQGLNQAKLNLRPPAAAPAAPPTLEQSLRSELQKVRVLATGEKDEDDNDW